MGDTSQAKICVGVLISNDKLPWGNTDCEAWYYFTYLKCDPMLNCRRHYDQVGRLLPGHMEKDIDNTYDKFDEFKKANPMPFFDQTVGFCEYSEQTVICVPDIYQSADCEAVEITPAIIEKLMNLEIPDSFIQFVEETLGKKREDIKIWLVPYYG